MKVTLLNKIDGLTMRVDAARDDSVGNLVINASDMWTLPSRTLFVERYSILDSKDRVAGDESLVELLPDPFGPLD